MVMAMSTPSAESTQGWSDEVALAAPLFKWAGGKQRFLWEHRERLPEFSGRYIEPFAGGLSVLFHLARRSETPLESIASDTNLRLIRCYQEIRRDWMSVADRVNQLRAAYEAADDKSRFYYALREEYNKLGPSAGAARFIVLMAAGWNGVYRVNQRGHFNVPPGQVRGTLAVPTDLQLRAVSRVFQSTQLRASSWESTIAVARAGDFIFLDPPYYTQNRTQLYARASNTWGLAEHVRLADALVDLAARGVSFLLTNSGHLRMIELYSKRGLAIEKIPAHRSISSKTRDRGRGADDEIIVTPRDIRSAKNAEADLALRVRFGIRSSKGNQQ